MKIINGSVCAPQGFLAAGEHVGIKRKSHKLDLAVIYSEHKTTSAGVFTKNNIKAAPVILSQQHLKAKNYRAIVVNSGNANACTGIQGMKDAKQMAIDTAKALQLDPREIAVSSTGVIGVPLPMEKIRHGISAVCEKLHAGSGDQAANAIMTTDTFPKSIAIEIKIGGKPVRIGGIAKGSGMIHPNMGTMLAFITTDAAISKVALQKALSQINQDSFNMISVDGDTSTNDVAFVMANGMANHAPIKSATDPNWKIFYKALSHVCTYLAKEIARDGEGATKLIEIHIKGAANKNQAQLAALSVCRSPLVKTAVYGEDANWGRIACAIGYSGAKLNPKKLNVKIGNMLLMKNGNPLVFDEAAAKLLLQQKIVTIEANLGVGKGEATSWGCDLTYDYVKINASYRS